MRLFLFTSFLSVNHRIIEWFVLKEMLKIFSGQLVPALHYPHCAFLLYIYSKSKFFHLKTVIPYCITTYFITTKSLTVFSVGPPCVLVGHKGFSGAFCSPYWATAALSAFLHRRYFPAHRLSFHPAVTSPCFSYSTVPRAKWNIPGRVPQK